MKKFLWLFVMLLTITVTSYAQSTREKVKEIAGDTYDVFTTDTLAVATHTEVVDTTLTAQIYGDVKSGLLGLSKALKTTVEHVYTVLIKQQLVKSIVWLLIFIFGFLLLCLYNKPIWNWAKKSQYESEGVSWIPFGLKIILALIMIVSAIGNIDTIVTGFVNPEYGAMKDIVEFIQEMK